MATPKSPKPHHAQAHALHLDPEVRADVRQRLLSVKGHVEAVLRMLEDDSVYCVDALKQIKAVQRALGRVGEQVLRSHLAHHVVSARERGDDREIVDELMQVLKLI